MSLTPSPSKVQASVDPVSTDRTLNKPFVSSGIDLDDQVSLTVSQIPKSMDSSDEDGDDKSIQCINDDEEVEGDAMDMFRKSQVPLNVASGEANEADLAKSNETLEEKEEELKPSTEAEDSKNDDNETETKEVEAKADQKIELETRQKENIATDAAIKDDSKQEETKDKTITEVDDPLSTLAVATETVEPSEEEKPGDAEDTDASDPKVDVPEPSPEASPEPKHVTEESPEPTEVETVEPEQLKEEQEQEPEPEAMSTEPTLSAKEESPSVKKPKIPALSKGLFDDSEDEDEEDDGLFSFTSSKKEPSNPVE